MDVDKVYRRIMGIAAGVAVVAILALIAACLVGCGDITAVAPPGGDAGGAGTGGGAVGGAGGERSNGGAPGGQGGSLAGSTGSAGQAGAGTAGAGGWGGTPQDGGSPPAPCPPSDAACPAGTTCQLTSATAGLCVCPGYPQVAYCGTGCSDLQVDPKNCGTCRHACGQGQSCQTGNCR